MATLPPNYFSRFSGSANYEEHLFIAGRALQSAEINDLQKQFAFSLRGVADSLFKDGDVVRDAAVSVDSGTASVQCQGGAVYIRGMVRGVSPATLTGVPMVGVVAIGIRLVETIITVDDDPDLADPAAGTRNYGERGAERLRVMPTWSTGLSGVGEFYPIYSITDGVLDAKDPPPSLDSVTQALARYDRDSAGGTYIVNGLEVRALADVGTTQFYSLAEGRCRVYGYGLDFNTSRRVPLAVQPDLKTISNEPHLSAGSAPQRINFDRTPGTAISAVSITAEKTVTLTHGGFTGAADLLPDTSVLSILSVTQGASTYTQGGDYILAAGRVDWSPGGAEPSPGSTYQVTYRYITLAAPTAIDDAGFTVAGSVTGTLILVSYSQKLPRIDRLCVNVLGVPVWVIGVSAEENAQLPDVPEDYLAVASIYQTWTASRRVSNDGVRVVPMPVLSGIDNRFDRLLQLVAQQRLESNIHTRESGSKKGLFTDPFIDDTQRDAGTPQTAAVVRGELLLPIAAMIYQVSADVTGPATLPYNSVMALQQPFATGSMKINPYMSFAVPPAPVTLTPAIDRWTVVESVWSSDATSRFVVGQGDQSSSASTTRTLLTGVTSAPIENLRPITVSYQITGFGAGEALQSMTFDSISLPTGGAVADGAGVVVGSFTIPTGIPSGTKAFRAVGAGGTEGRATFTGQGTLERQTWQRQTTITETRWQSPPPPAPFQDWGGSGGGGDGGGGADPLAQTFTLTENMQMAGVEIWFIERPTTEAIVQLRTTAVGFPTITVLAQARMLPSSVSLGGPTRFNFAAPVNLIAGSEYAFVVICNDPVGSVAVAELGSFDAANQRWITSQPYTVGVLLSSSNAVTWTAHQDRDMTFRLLRAEYTASTRNIILGSVTVTDATDLLLMSFAERPASSTQVDYLLTLPDASVVTVADGQPVQLPAPISGVIGVVARLSGNQNFSPVLLPGTQLVAGTIAGTASYVSRAVPAGANVRIKVIYEARLAGAATIIAAYKGPDVADVWTNLPAPTTRQVDDGFVEFVHEITNITEVTIQARLTLAGSTAARPRVRDLRVIVL
jgi:Domain of unknown function (DUF4815)